MPRRKSSSRSIGSGSITLDRLRELLAAPKALATVPTWEPSGDTLQLTCPLMIGGAIVEGLEFRRTALLRRPRQEVMLGLIYAPAGARGGMFERVDAWPLRRHCNTGHGPKKLRFRTIDPGVSHRHGLEHNAHLGVDGLLGRLEIAGPLDPQPESWAALWNLVCALWHIDRDPWLPTPPWSRDLFSASGNERRRRTA